MGVPDNGFCPDWAVGLHVQNHCHTTPDGLHRLSKHLTTKWIRVTTGKANGLLAPVRVETLWVSDVCDAPLLGRLGKWEETFGISGLLLRIVEFPNVSPFFFVKPREVELELVPAFSRGLGDLFSDEILELLRVPSFSRGDKARLIGAAVSDTMHDPLVSPTCCVSESPSDVLINRSEDVGQSLAHDVMPSKPEPFSENRSRLTSELNVSTGLPYLLEKYI